MLEMRQIPFRVPHFDVGLSRQGRGKLLAGIAVALSKVGLSTARITTSASASALSRAFTLPAYSHRFSPSARTRRPSSCCGWPGPSWYGEDRRDHDLLQLLLASQGSFRSVRPSPVELVPHVEASSGRRRLTAPRCCERAGGRLERSCTLVPAAAKNSRRCSTDKEKFKFCPEAHTQVLTPTTSPRPLTNGPPLLPGEIGAVV